MTQKKFARVAIDSPLRRIFDYRIPEAGSTFEVGQRVLVPFGRRDVTGIVVGVSHHTDLDTARLKSIHRQLDERAIFDPLTFSLIRWAARYYHYPLGAALFSALPPALRRTNEAASNKSDYGWQLNKDIHSDQQLSRAPKQAEIVDWLKSHPGPVTHTALKSKFPNSQSSILALRKRGFITRVTLSSQTDEDPHLDMSTQVKLTDEQNHASQKIINALGSFKVLLLEGVTGSGKTEVYFNAISHLLACQSEAQILILVPEIGLTPQLHSRLARHFGIRIGLLHSNTSEQQRKQTWLTISQGGIRIILGTRLAVFTPMPHLALVIVDEEHDASLKQQESFLYHARDVAIYLAKQRNIPVVLGSATPSFESLRNAFTNRYQHLYLNQRAHANPLPSIRLVDMRVDKPGNILSSQLRQAMHQHLQAGQQVILFLNRRGYSPAILCHDCGWVAHCLRCDANLTYHSHHDRLICHHCDRIQKKPLNCPNCHSSNLIMVGHGTQRIEEILHTDFAEYPSVRLDRDITRRKGVLEAILKQVQQQQFQIITGTQILSKGHDFPNVSLVGILDIDYGIHSSDFRALERSAQLLIQVAGRSGRRHTQGEVFVQTHTPDHPLLQTLVHQGYASFARQALDSRREWNLPPFSHHIAIRARSQNNHDVFLFLDKVKTLTTQLLPGEIHIQGPITAAMEKKAGQFRAFILLSMDRRGSFTSQIDSCLAAIDSLKEARQVRWSVDVDPIDNFM